MEILKNAQGFEWDVGNSRKNLIKHGVSQEECEEAFFDPHKKGLGTVTHPVEDRHLFIGMTKAGRLLFVVFTLRKDKIRVISVRDLNRREKGLYEEGA